MNETKISTDFQNTLNMLKARYTLNKDLFIYDFEDGTKQIEIFPDSEETTYTIVTLAFDENEKFLNFLY